ncbi:MAG: peptidase, partial [Leptospiraceae bacterium]|nr:peptidase [Leptospiraceae bacterium]
MPQEATVSFSPEGFVKRIKQVQVRFSQAMVSFGDPKANSNIFKISCPEKGKGRWLDDRNYVYEFDKELEAGISCTFELLDSVVTLSNKKVLGKKKFEINTGGPQVIRISPYEGSTITEDQIFAIHTDGEIDESSVSEGAYLNVDIVKSKVPITLLSHSNSDVKKIIESRFKGNQKNLYFFKSKLNLPPSKQVEFVWSGVRSKSGLPNTEKQVFTFQVQEPLSVSYYCERTNPNSGCVPFGDISLSFSAPIPVEELSKITMTGGKKEYKVTLREGDSSSENSVYYAYIQGPFPEKTKFTINIPKSFKDDAGRTLSDKYRTLSVNTSEFPPLAKFSARFGIIEAENPILPVTLRNLEPNLVNRMISLYPESSPALKNTAGKMKKISSSEIWYWMRRVYNSNRETSVFQTQADTATFQMPRKHDAKAFEVVGIPLKEKGFYVVEIQSNALGNALIGPKSKMYVPTAALVTNMAVHLKLGRENSLVWVTQLNNAQPVSGATISIQDCKGNQLFNGVTNNIGIVYVPKNLKAEYCSWGEFNSGLLVIAEKGDDLSFVHSNWNQGIEAWRFNLPYGENYYT